MAIPHSVLMVELLMSADRLITAAQAAAEPMDDDAWPPATILGHVNLVDEQVWMPRIALMVEARGGPPPEFAWWEPDEDLTQAAFMDVSVDEAGARLLSGRTTLLHRLRDLSDDDWTATAAHQIFGVLDVEGLLIQVLAHDEEHRGSLLLSP
jgi:hypothetical protein